MNKGKVDNMTRDVCPSCGGTDIILVDKDQLCCLQCRNRYSGVPYEFPRIFKIYDGLGDQTKPKIIYSHGALDIEDEAEDLITVKCSHCGAEIMVNTETSTGAQCHWCRNHLSLNDPLPNGAIPDAILPFKITKEDAQACMEKYYKYRKFLAHPQFKKEFNIENIYPIYLPYFIIGLAEDVALMGDAEETRRKYTIDKKTYYDVYEYQVNRSFTILTDEFMIESKKDYRDFEGYDNSKNVINAIMPFDVQNAIKYQTHYTRGYTIEKRDINAKDYQKVLPKTVEDMAKGILGDQGYDRGIRWRTINTNTKARVFTSALCPVYLYSFVDNKQNKHFIAVNGRTEETVGSIPPNKITLSILTFLIFLVCMVFTFFLFMASDDGDNLGVFILLSFIIPASFYKFVYEYFRNRTQRHFYERETFTTILNYKENDKFIKIRERERSPRTKQANHDRFYGDHAIKQTLFKD